MWHKSNWFKVIAFTAASVVLVFYVVQYTNGEEAFNIEISEERMEKAVAVSLEIIDIQNDAKEELETAESKEEKNKIAEKAKEQIQAILKEVDLNLEEYQKIMTAIDSDKELLEEFLKKLKSRRPNLTEPDENKPPIPPESITTRQLEQAAQIFRTTVEISRELEEKLADEKQEEMIKKAVEQAEARIMKAAKDAEMEAEEYKNIMRTLQHDEELRDKFQELISE